MQVDHQPISIVIRAKNEAKWLGSCLFAVCHQDRHNIEIILVDNESSDDTVNIAKSFGCKIIHISDREFNYSKALNIGIAECSGSLIAILSGHCVPVHDQWLNHMVMNFYDDEVGAVYGRQEPLPDTSPSDKRDLWITFGLDRKTQKKDYFFHNANAMIRKSLWDKTPFDEALHGAEDQAWAKKILAEGLKIVYEPLANVYHQHGIHHGGNHERAIRVVKMIESIQNEGVS